MNKNIGIAILSIVLLVVAGAVFYLWYTDADSGTTQTAVNENSNTNVEIPDNTTPATPGKIQARFASYEPVSVTVNPQVPAYTVESDFSNVDNADLYEYMLANSDASELLQKNGFAVQAGWTEEFFELYEPNRYRYIASFVTTDSIMHTYHLLFDHLLRETEENFLIDKLSILIADMKQASVDQYDALQGTNWETAAKRNIAYFSVADALLNENAEIPELVTSEVNQELAMIEAKDGIHEAIIINMGEGGGANIQTSQGELPTEVLLEDYSQYVPRGHYDRTEELGRYFKSMMWLGRMTFRLKRADETVSALLATRAILGDDEIEKTWNAIYEPTNFFVGKSDDITYYDLAPLVTSAYGESSVLADMPDTEAAFESFYESARQLDPPQINSIPIFESSIQPDREEEIKGFRFMGQRFTLDASIFQRLVCREVGNLHGTMDCGGSTEDSRMLPNGLDVPAAMGSEEAYSILDDLGETKYLKYPENIQTMREYIESLDASIWTQNLYWGWLFSLKPLLEPAEEGYPQFMQNDAWVRKDLNTYLGSWSELKHDTILYAKQVYAELGAGGEIPEYDDRGYVEPRPDLYARLAGLTAMTKKGLSDRGLISESMETNLGLMQTLVTSLKTIAEKELNNEPRTDEEYELIRSYGGQLEHFWLEVNKSDIDASGMDSGNYLHENPAAIIADVATDPNGQVLEVGTGHINQIYVLVEVEGVLKIAKGGVFSYYEFPWPLNDRLTDKKWRELLDSDSAPTLPAWTDLFTIPQDS